MCSSIGVEELRGFWGQDRAPQGGCASWAALAQHTHARKEARGAPEGSRTPTAGAPTQGTTGSGKPKAPPLPIRIPMCQCLRRYAADQNPNHAARTARPRRSAQLSPAPPAGRGPRQMGSGGGGGTTRGPRGGTTKGRGLPAPHCPRPGTAPKSPPAEGVEPGGRPAPPPPARTHTHTRSPLRAAPGPAAPPLPAVAGPGGRGRPSPLSRRWPGHGGGRRRRSRGRCRRRRHHRRRHRRRLPLRRGAGGALRRGESSPACAAVGGGGGAQQLGGKGKGEGRGPREGSDSPSSRAPRRPAGHFVCVPQCSAARGGGAKGRAGPRVCACAVSAVGGARREWSSGGRSGAPRERAGSAAGAQPYARVGRGCASAGSNACVRGLELCTWDTAVDACMRARSGTVHPQARVAASSQAVRACINREHALIRSVHTEHLSACMKGPRMCMPATPVHACMHE